MDNLVTQSWDWWLIYDSGEKPTIKDLIYLLEAMENSPYEFSYEEDFVMEKFGEITGKSESQIWSDILFEKAKVKEE